MAPALVFLPIMCLVIGPARTYRGDESLFYRNGRQLAQIRMEKNFVTMMLTSMTSSAVDDVETFDVDVKNGRIYVYRTSKINETGSISWYPVYEPEKMEEVIRMDTRDSEMNTFRVEWATKRIYYTTGEGGGVNVINKGNISTLSNGTFTTDLVIDSCFGYVFWIDSGNDHVKPRIEGMNLYGSGRVTLVAGEEFSGFEPTALAVDIRNQRLFYSCSHRRSIESVDYYGKNRRIHSMQHDVISLAFWNDWLYFSDTCSGEHTWCKDSDEKSKRFIEDGRTGWTLPHSGIFKMDMNSSRTERIFDIRNTFTSLRIFDRNAEFPVDCIVDWQRMDGLNMGSNIYEMFRFSVLSFMIIELCAIVLALAVFNIRMMLQSERNPVLEEKIELWSDDEDEDEDEDEEEEEEEEEEEGSSSDGEEDSSEAEDVQTTNVEKSTSPPSSRSRLESICNSDNATSSSGEETSDDDDVLSAEEGMEVASTSAEKESFESSSSDEETDSDETDSDEDSSEESDEEDEEDTTSAEQKMSDEDDDFENVKPSDEGEVQTLSEADGMTSSEDDHSMISMEEFGSNE